MNSHTVQAFDAELAELHARVAEMGGIAEAMLGEAMDALARSDASLAGRVVQTDARLDALQREVEERAILLIARRQPMAVDLRDVVGAIRIAGDVERVGDQVKGIAKRVAGMAGYSPPRGLMSGLRSMSLLALAQFKAVMDAYAAGDDKKALEVWRRDGEIDDLYTSLFRELLTYMMEDPRNIGDCTQLLFSAKNLERVGDHATNIAETVHYVVTGEALAMERPKGETSREGALSAMRAGAAAGAPAA